VNGATGDGSTRWSQLEFAAVREEIARLAASQPGRLAVEALEPRLGDRDGARREHALVDDACAALLAGDRILLDGLADVCPLAERAARGGILSGAELRLIAASERSLAAAVHSLRAARPEGPLARLLARHVEDGGLIARLDGALDEAGNVTDAASDRLASVRRRIGALRARVQELCRRVMQAAHEDRLLTEPVVTVRGGRYVLPVRADAAAHFPGVVLDQSVSGATVFMEPLTAVETANELRRSQAEEHREVERILTELSSRVGVAAERLCANADLGAQLDAIAARARYALAHRAVCAVIADEPMLRLVQARHPLLGEKAVPLDVELGVAWDGLVLSGPNMGGKTVVLKTVGVAVLLAYAGIPLCAAAGTVIGDIRHLHCAIGDQQSLQRGLSSYAAEVRALKDMLADAGPHTLALVDEIGAATEPAAGAALAQAWIEAMLAAGSKVIVSTHLTPLKAFAASAARVTNASLLFDPQTLAPTFQLQVGIPGQSLAFEMARRLELDPRIIERAHGLVAPEVHDLERALAEVAEQRQALSRLRAESEAALAALRRREEEYARRDAAWNEEKRSFEEQARAMVQKAAEDARAAMWSEERERVMPRRRRASALSRAGRRRLESILADMRRSLGLEPEPQSPASAVAVTPGVQVYVTSLGAAGTVEAVYERDVLVAVGSMRALVARADVRPAADIAARSRAAPSAPAQPRAADEADPVCGSIDIRGLSVDEAWPLVDKALDDAMLAHRAELRIIHGKGTGRLGRGIRDLLTSHPHVRGVAEAAAREGGSGVTIVRLD
jgi:DNA mismatch repair protein MutS2